MRSLPALAVVLIVAGILGGAWATPRLQEGWVEIPGHWWSTLAVLPAVVGAGLAALAFRSRRRAR